MKSALRQIIAWLVLVVAMAALRSTVERAIPQASHVSDALGREVVEMSPARLAAVTTFAFLLLGAWLSGIITRSIRLPKITGYLLFGVLVSPSLSPFLLPGLPPLVSTDAIANLKLVNALAIALIGLTAGGEIRIGLFRKGFGSVVIISAFGFVTVFAGIMTLLWLGRGRFDLLVDLPAKEVLVIAMLAAIVATANSPAVVVAMLAETGAKGLMSEIGLAVTVCKDLVLVILFTIATAVGVSLLAGGHAESTGRGEIVVHLAWHLLGSVVFGGAIGLLLATLMDRIGRRMPLLVVATALGIALVSEALGFESLLAALTAGFFLANAWPIRSAPLFHSIEELSTPVFCVFFAMAGTVIDVTAVARMWPIALSLFAVRLTTLAGGSILGCAASRQPRHYTWWMWTMFTANAGVAIALAQTISKSFPDHPWSVTLVSLLLSTIAIDQLVGPILMKQGLTRAGEIPS